jgi:hypothetical protein
MTGGRPRGLSGDACPFGRSDTLAPVRRILVSDADPERRLEELLAERRQEVEDQAERLEEAVRDLERREQLLRDSRTSLERLLRLGTSDLDSREAELVELIRDVTAREERVRAEELEVARRREELGAVELKRLAVERRERAVAEREEELAEREPTAVTAASDDELSTASAPILVFVPGPGYRLGEIEHAPLRAGADLVLDGEPYLVARTGPSPLPGDRRRCAYLVRGPHGSRPGSSVSDAAGSS